MNKTYKSLVKNMGYLTISNFASKILVFLLVPLYTSVLSTAEYGIYDAIVTTVQFIAPIVIFNISDGVMRFLLEGSKEKEICSIGYRYVSIGITIIGILCVVNSITGLVSFLNGYELFCFLYAAFYILNNHYIQMAKGFNAVSLMAIGGVIGTISMLLANIVFLLIFHWGKTADGAEADGVVVDVNSLVSMNMWGLNPDFLDVLENGFKEFFEKEVPSNPQKAEYLIPIFIGELLEQGKMSVKVLKTNDTWYGMTYHEDVAAVKNSFKKMLADGVYKADLFSDL